MKNISFCALETISEWASLREQTEIRKRWTHLLRDNLRENLTELSMNDFDRLYSFAVEHLLELSIEFGLSANTFAEFAVQWARVLETAEQNMLIASEKRACDVEVA
jgi:hypothetical protein